MPYKFRLGFDGVNRQKEVWRKECRVCVNNPLSYVVILSRHFAFRIQLHHAFCLDLFIWLHVVIHLPTCDDCTCTSALINKSSLHCCFRPTSTIIRGPGPSRGLNRDALLGGVRLRPGPDLGYLGNPQQWNNSHRQKPIGVRDPRANAGMKRTSVVENNLYFAGLLIMG